MQDLLEVDRQDDHLACVPQPEQDVHRAGLAEAGQLEQVRADQRVRLALLDPPERDACGYCRQHGSAGHRRHPARDGRLRDGEHCCCHRRGDRRRAPDVQVALRTAVPRLTKQSRREQRGGHPDRNVDQEHGSPAEELDQHAAQYLAGHEADRRGSTVFTERAVTPRALGKPGRDQGERSRRDDGCAGALDHARRDQQHRVLREAAGQRGRREGQQPGDEHPAAAEQIGGAAAQDQQPAECDRVTGDHPLHRGGREAEFPLDGGQGHVHDAEVEHHHEGGGQDQRQPQSLVLRHLTCCGRPPGHRGGAGAAWLGGGACERGWLAGGGGLRRHGPLTYIRYATSRF